MGEREAPRTEGLAHSIDHPIDKSVDQSIQLKHPTRLVNSCKTYYYPFCIQKRSLVTHPCKTWIANLWFNFFLPTPTINFKSSRQLFFFRWASNKKNIWKYFRGEEGGGLSRSTARDRNSSDTSLRQKYHMLPTRVTPTLPNVYIPGSRSHWTRMSKEFFFENRPVLGFSLSRLERIYTIFASLSMKNQNGITPLFLMFFFFSLCTVLYFFFMYRTIYSIYVCASVNNSVREERAYNVCSVEEKIRTWKQASKII